jgi:Zn-dependent alcohol dehydrogenase
MSKMDQALQLAYSAAGIVEQVADGITDIKVGDRY